MAGVPIEALLRASRAGRISLRYYDQLHPPPGPAIGPVVRRVRGVARGRRRPLSQLFAAFGLAEPEPDTQLTVEDERVVAMMAKTVGATGQPDLALRATRVFGEGARRAGGRCARIYGERSVAGGDLQGLPVDAVFERLLQPWARFARESATWLPGWRATTCAGRSTTTASPKPSASSRRRGTWRRGPASARGRVRRPDRFHAIDRGARGRRRGGHGASAG